MHDDEAIRCITTTIRVESFERVPDSEVLAAAILDALSKEGLYVIRDGKNA